MARRTSSTKAKQKGTPSVPVSPWEIFGAGSFSRLAGQAVEYRVDAAERSVLCWDVMRRRGGIHLEHEDKGKLPVLSFKYEMLMDARDFDRPSNYFLEPASEGDTKRVVRRDPGFETRLIGG